MVWRVKDNQSESECCFSATRLSPSPASPALLVGFNLSGTLVRVSFRAVLSLIYRRSLSQYHRQEVANSQLVSQEPIIHIKSLKIKGPEGLRF